jgi:DNA gyrase subunit B
MNGAHIHPLLLTFFYRFMPELIDADYLYIAQPPLYSITAGRNVVAVLRRGHEAYFAAPSART